MIRKGVLKDIDAEATSQKLATVEAQPAENGQNVQVEVTSETNHVGSQGKDQTVRACVRACVCSGCREGWGGKGATCILYCVLSMVRGWCIKYG